MLAKFRTTALASLTVIILPWSICLAGCEKSHATIEYVASVNGEEIKVADFMTMMAATSGSTILQEMVDSTLVLQEARKQNIAVPEGELEPVFKEIRRNVRDLGSAHILEQQAKAKALLRLLVLKDVPEADLKAVFELFKEDLVLYEVARIVVPTRDTAKQLSIALETGSKFEEVAAISSIDESTSKKGGSVGALNIQGLRRVFGKTLTRRVVEMSEGQTSDILQITNGRFMILKLLNKKTTYEQLCPSIQDIYENRNARALIYRLNAEASIISPFMVKEDSAVALPGSSASGTKVSASPAQAPGVPVEKTQILPPEAEQVTTPSEPENVTK